MPINAREKLTAQQYKAIELLISRHVTKDTYEQIAEKVGVSYRTLFEWRKHNGLFNQELQEQSRALLKSHVTEAYSELTKIITSSKSHDRDKINAIQLLSKLSGELEQSHTVRVEPVSMDELMKKLDDL